MRPETALWVYLVASAALAVWLLIRSPNRRPETVLWAALLFVGGQLASTAGLFVLPVVLGLHDGAQIALPTVILPVFLVLWLTVGWLFWAIIDRVGSGPRGGHPLS